VKLFLEDERIEITKNNNQGVSPMQIAAQGGHVEVIKLLLTCERYFSFVKLEEQIEAAFRGAVLKHKENVVNFITTLVTKPQQTMYQIRKEFHILDLLAAELFLTTVFINDEYFTVPNHYWAEFITVDDDNSDETKLNSADDQIEITVEEIPQNMEEDHHQAAVENNNNLQNPFEIEEDADENLQEPQNMDDESVPAINAPIPENSSLENQENNNLQNQENSSQENLENSSNQKFKPKKLKVIQVYEKNDTLRFFRILMKLHFDLQMLLCNRVYDLGKNIIPGIYLEKALRKMVKRIANIYLLRN